MNKTFKQTLKFYKYSTLRQAEFSKIAKAKLELLFRAYKFNFEAKEREINNSAFYFELADHHVLFNFGPKFKFQTFFVRALVNEQKIFFSTPSGIRAYFSWNGKDFEDENKQLLADALVKEVMNLIKSKITTETLLKNYQDRLDFLKKREEDHQKKITSPTWVKLVAKRGKGHQPFVLYY